MLHCQIGSHRMSLCAIWVLIAAWNFPCVQVAFIHFQSFDWACSCLSPGIVSNSCSNKITSHGKFHAAIKTQIAHKDIRWEPIWQCSIYTVETGACSVKTLKVYKSNLYLHLYLIRSQSKSISSGVIWSYFLLRVISLAAVFWAVWSFESTLSCKSLFFYKAVLKLTKHIIRK
jgi:hypothetical protein